MKTFNFSPLLIAFDQVRPVNFGKPPWTRSSGPLLRCMSVCIRAFSL